VNPAKYPTLETGEGKSLTYDINDFENPIAGEGDIVPGISFQFNSGENTDGSFTVTKATFTYVQDL
jgi:hypothetical protein